MPASNARKAARAALQKSAAPAANAPEVVKGEEQSKTATKAEVTKKKTAPVEAQPEVATEVKKAKKSKAAAEQPTADDGAAKSKKAKKQAQEEAAPSVPKPTPADGLSREEKKKKKKRTIGSDAEGQAAPAKQQKLTDGGKSATAWDEEEAATDSAAEKKGRRTVPKEEKGGAERVSCTVFCGQLPYTATEADIKRHFKSCASDGEISVRLLTKRASEGGGSRGMAFVELASEAAVHTALRLHHSVSAGRCPPSALPAHDPRRRLAAPDFTPPTEPPRHAAAPMCHHLVPCDVPQVMGGRRINVERTVGGGGAKDDRKKKLSSLREMQGKQMTQTVRQLCEDILPAADAEVEEADDESAAEGTAASRVTRADVDERVLDFLCTVRPP